VQQFRLKDGLAKVVQIGESYGKRQLVPNNGISRKILTSSAVNSSPLSPYFHSVHDLTNRMHHVA
jgi:hypothetical protein